MEFTGEIDDLVVDYSTNRQKLVLRSNVDITDIFESFKGKGLDLKLKRMAQRYYENHYGSREDFIKEFGKNYL